MAAARAAWRTDVAAGVGGLAPERLVFLDECGVLTGMARLYGRGPRGERARAAVPHGPWARLSVLGALLSLVVPAYHAALLPFLVALVLIAVSAMLVGDVPRYRYPIDPLMYVMASGGLVGLTTILVRLARRRGEPRPERSTATALTPSLTVD